MIKETTSPEVGTSIGNFFDQARPIATAFFPIEFINAEAQKEGYAGIEWHPFRFMCGLQIRTGILTQKGKDAIVSAHQSYRGEKSLNEALKHPNKKLAAISYFVLPQRESSIKNLRQLQKVLQRKIPIVLYPSDKTEAAIRQDSFAEKLFQPNPEIMQQWGINSPEDLISEAYRRGYTGLCLDLFHLRELGTPDLNPWQESLPQLLPHTKEIHVSAGREDITVPHEVDTTSELEDLLFGTKSTDLSKMLRYISSQEWRSLIVTEIPASSIRGVLSNSANLIDAHRQITTNIKELLS